MWVVGIVAGLLILAWAGVKIHALVVEYPAQLAVAGISFAVLSVATIAARIHHVLHDKVAISPPPPRQAIGAGPTIIAPYRPPDDPMAMAQPGICEGPGCGRPHGADPWAIEVGRPGEPSEEHRFCSRACVDNWTTAARRP